MIFCGEIPEREFNWFQSWEFPQKWNYSRLEVCQIKILHDLHSLKRDRTECYVKVFEPIACRIHENVETVLCNVSMKWITSRMNEWRQLESTESIGDGFWLHHSTSLSLSLNDRPTSAAFIFVREKLLQNRCWRQNWTDFKEKRIARARGRRKCQLSRLIDSLKAVLSSLCHFQHLNEQLLVFC